MDCLCPRPAALTTVNRVTCPENLGQIQRIAIRRAVSAAAFDAATNDIETLASWTALLEAADDTKIVITPYLENFIIPQAEPITRGGGDNTTVDGVQKVLGAGAITATGNLVGVPVEIIEQLRELMCEPELEVFLFNQYGRIICRNADPEAAPGAEKYRGIPIQSFFVPFPGNNGLNTEDESILRFSFAEDWAKNRVIITPDFNLKTALLAPAA